jgi:hypothetical protein
VSGNTDDKGRSRTVPRTYCQGHRFPTSSEMSSTAEGHAPLNCMAVGITRRKCRGKRGRRTTKQQQQYRVFHKPEFERSHLRNHYIFTLQGAPSVHRCRKSAGTFQFFQHAVSLLPELVFGTSANQFCTTQLGQELPKLFNVAAWKWG